MERLRRIEESEINTVVLLSRIMDRMATQREWNANGMRLQGLRLLWFIAMLLAPAQLGALEINVIYDAELSQAPAFDPDAMRLRQLVESAAAVYEDIIEDDWTLNLKFTWGELSEGMLGVAATTQTTMAGLPVASRMRFNTSPSVDWFIDDTPDDHSEFQLIQSTVANLSNRSIQSAFSGSPPAQLEVGYAGAKRELEGTTDLYSVVLHELGHAVGLTQPVFGTEVEDGDFDVPSQLVGGLNFGIQYVSEQDTAHLAAPRTSMFPQIIEDIRRLPSSTDILALASATGWTNIDLPRKEFLSGDSWNEPASWIGNRVPDADDLVTLRQQGIVSIDAPAHADSISLGEGTQLSVKSKLTAHDLTLNGERQIIVLGDSFQGIHLKDVATINGELIVQTDSVLSVGQSFELLTAGEIRGEFEVIHASSLTNMSGLVVDVLPNSIVATVAHNGDANADGMINFSDFLTIAQNFGDSAGWRQGDFNGDGRTAFDDFLNVAQQFGMSTVAAASSSPIATSVPEPSAWTGGLWLSLVLMRLWRRSRRSGLVTACFVSRSPSA